MVESPPTDIPGSDEKRDKRPFRFFWLGWLALQLILFLPHQLVDLEAGHGLPQLLWRFEGSLVDWAELLLWRPIQDPWRLTIEFLVIGLLWAWFPRVRRKSTALLIGILYLALLLFQIEEAFVSSYYQLAPNFYNDFYLLLDGWQFVVAGLNLAWWQWLAVGFSGGTAVVALLWLLAVTFNPQAPFTPSRWGQGVGLASLLLALLLLRLQPEAQRNQPELVVHSAITKIQATAERSLAAAEQARQFDDRLIASAYTYPEFSLQDSPNIYLIFVESYGSILHEGSDNGRRYAAFLEQMETELAQSGWHSRSTRSFAPTWGGGSWMSYTSALFGLRIESHPQYLALLEKYQFKPYPHLPQTLERAGYEHIRLSSISTPLKEQDRRSIRDFFAIDRWIEFSDLAYEGSLFGWGGAPPDQYALHFGDQLVKNETSGPFLFFYITQNSHYPWTGETPPVLSDWQAFNDSDRTIDFAAEDPGNYRSRFTNYITAIDYQLAYLTEFILSQEEDALFVLIGDHQPPQISRRSDGYDVPLHVISQNKVLVDSFAEFGFIEGLQTRALTPELYHEGFYSMLMRVLVKNFGTEEQPLPPFLPRGVTLAPFADITAETAEEKNSQ